MARMSGILRLNDVLSEFCMPCLRVTRAHPLLLHPTSPLLNVQGGFLYFHEAILYALTLEAR